MIAVHLHVLQNCLEFWVSSSSKLIMQFIIHQIFLLTHDDWSKHVTWPNIPLLKLGNIWEHSPIFKTVHVAKKYLKDNKHNSLHLALKCAWIFVLGHCLFLEAHSFPQAALSENCLLFGKDNVRRQISDDIFVPNGDLVIWYD